ncbi:GNAT family N-acetyltransferase [Corallincola luteus]|uniref:GNAT family N-acetyltransferase n=1 Tax=Corallincola luteus TaxID=1775177 RepID=A0ABY2ANR1_9GAMM|nr:GNAT family N-acetyltransferase [Corallincola luteus]
MVIIREIEARDNVALAAVIRRVLTEFGANQPGFAWQDPSLDQMYQTYQDEKCHYLVIEQDGVLLGGGGIGPLAGNDDGVCELQKMYLAAAGRGFGWGRQLLVRLEEWAAQHYCYCYLETLASMAAANVLYLHQGYRRLQQPKGCTGHGGCDTWYGKSLAAIPVDRV